MSFTLKLKQKADISIAISGLALSLFGLIMVLSASQISAAETYGNQYHFFIKQLFSWFVGAGLFFFFLKCPVEKLYKNYRFMLYAIFALLIAVFLPFVGQKIAGVHRWISLGFGRFQPAEFVKLLVIIYFSGWLGNRAKDINDIKKTLIPFTIILGVICFLIVSQPDMGTMMIVGIVALGIIFASNIKLSQVVILVIIGAVLALLLATKSGYRAQRLSVFLNRSSVQDQSQNESYHNYQALLAIGSGGVWGVGFGQSTSKYSYLPQSHTDSIFAVIAEELGYVRTGIFLLVYLFLVWRGLLVAKNANSQFVRLMAVGISVLYFAQALINIGGMLQIIPLTGIPLPFVSYGGTSLMLSLAALGILTNLSRETKRDES